MSWPRGKNFLSVGLVWDLACELDTPATARARERNFSHIFNREKSAFQINCLIHTKTPKCIPNKLFIRYLYLFYFMIKSCFLKNTAKNSCCEEWG